MFPLTKPAPTDLKKCYHLRGKRYIYNNSIWACQYFRRKSISLRRWVHSIGGAMVLRKSLIFITVKWWWYIPLEYQVKKILRNENAVHIVKYMCTALSFQSSRLFIIRSYSVEKSFPIKSNIHCISRLCAAIPRCILPSHTTPEQAASWPEFSYNSSDARKLLDYCSKLEKWTSRKLLLGKSWPCDQAVKKGGQGYSVRFS